MTTQESTIRMLLDTGALVDGHFVLTSDRHSDKYINKDAVTMWPLAVSRLCGEIATAHASMRIDVVAAPAVGGIALGQWTAYHLSKLGAAFNRTVQSVYAEKVEKRVIKMGEGEELRFTLNRLGDLPEEVELGPGDELVIRRDKFEFKRGYDKVLPGKRVLVVEDILTTGGSAAKVIQAVRDCGGIVVATAVLANRGGVTSEDIDSELSALAEVTFDSWEEADCPLCRDNVPVNTDVGKGKLFLANQKG